MTHEKMNVHKALCELKVLDDRIQKATSSSLFVRANKHTNEKIGGVPLAKVREVMKADLQKVEDLMKRRDALKRAVIMSNASTVVTVGGNSYTVAEAIEMKNNGVAFKKALLRVLTYQLENAKNEVERNSGDAIERRAEQYVLSVIAAQPKDNKMSVDSAAMKSLRAQYIENNSYDLVDPNNIAEKIVALEEEIISFESDVDSALSVSNAITVIEFEY